MHTPTGVTPQGGETLGMLPRVLSLYNDLYDAATATAVARAAAPDGSLRHGFLDGALRSLCAADELLGVDKRHAAVEHLVQAMGLLHDAVIAVDPQGWAIPDPAVVAIDLACRVCEAIDLIIDAER